MRLLGGDVGERRQRKLAAGDGAGDFLERLDFRRATVRSAPALPRARMIACGSNGSKAAASRPQIAPALAVESCCDTTVAARPAKPSGRRRSGGRPAGRISAANRGSALRQRGKRRIEIGFAADMGQHVKVCRRMLDDAPVSRSVSPMYSRILRFAPSPNGYLHLGHAYSALLNHDLAREFGGRLLLRIEDIDAERCRPEYEEAIYDDLRWLGVTWQEPVRRQSEHFADYAAAIAKLEAQGLLYPSFESRSELSRDGRRARPARRLAARSRRRADLSRPGAQTFRRRTRAPPRRGRAFCAAARHGPRGGARRRADLDRDRRRPARPDRPHHRRAADVGRRRTGAQRNRRPAITSPSLSTTLCKA